MRNLSYISSERFWLKDHPAYGETWLEQNITNNPRILGLGDVVVKDRQRRQSGGGRLDLLLQDRESKYRYEVEIQLGKTDESHIVRAIEYWDTERKRYPQYEHCAVIVAEDITSRFLNVIGLFNGAIPLVALQMTALRIGDQFTVSFAKVLDAIALGSEDDEKEATDRNYWVNIASAETVSLADRMLEILQRTDRRLALKYNKFYIGLARDEQSDTFVIMRPKKKFLIFEPRLEQSDEWDRTLSETGLDLMDYARSDGRYRIRLTDQDIERHQVLLTNLIERAFQENKE